MNDVDVADQLRCYYNIQRITYKTWKPLWHFLLDTTVTNSYKIANTTEQRPYAELRKHSAHKMFRLDLVTGLFEHSERLTDPRGAKPGPRITKLVQKVNQAAIREHGIIQQLSLIAKPCTPCVTAGRKAINQIRSRKPLQELSNNSRVSNERRRRAPRSRYGCMLCDIRTCNNNSCFQEHLGAIG